jgi:transposase
MSTPLVLALDVSKGYGDFILLNAATQQVLEDRFRLDDTAAGHAVLSRQLAHWHRQYRPSHILLVAESTGGYEDNWLRLARTGKLSVFVRAYRINPKIIFHEYEAQRRSSIDDGVSALTIARHVAKNLDHFPFQPAYESDPGFAAARTLVTQRARLQQEATGHKNALLKLLYRYLPSVEATKSEGWPQYFLQMLSQYGSRQSMLRASRQGFKKLKRVPAGKAEQIHQALKQGVDEPRTPPAVVRAIQSHARQILHLQGEIKVVEADLLELAPVPPESVELLCSIKGMGRVSAVILLCYIEDVKRFAGAKQMAAFFGVQPRMKQSGDGMAYRPRMSKQGASLVRRELYLLAFRCLQTEPYLKAIYVKQRKRGKTHDAALGVLMHKLVRILFGMLKHNTPFCAGVDQLNQHQSEPESARATAKEAKTKSVNRYQPCDRADAPVSKQQRKARSRAKEDYGSQAANLAEKAGSP